MIKLFKSFWSVFLLVIILVYGVGGIEWAALANIILLVLIGADATFKLFDMLLDL